MGMLAVKIFVNQNKYEFILIHHDYVCALYFVRAEF